MKTFGRLLIVLFAVSLTTSGALAAAKPKAKKTFFNRLFTPHALVKRSKIERQRQRQLTKLNQNMPPMQPSWPTSYLNVTGFGNIDITPKTMQKTLAGEEADYFALANIGVDIDAMFAKYFTVHTGIAYFKTNKGQGDRYKNTGLMLDNAYLQFSDFARSPLYVEGGLFYLPFGSYNRYTIVPTLANVLSIAREPGVQFGISDWHGISATVYTSQGQLKKTWKRVQGMINFGAAIHYKYRQPRGFHVGAGAQYIYNMLNVNALSESEGFAPSYSNYVYTKAIPGAAFQAQAGYRWFTVYGQYVTALKQSPDLIKQYLNIYGLTNPIFGAKPSAWDAGAMLRVVLFNCPLQFDFTYSRSNNAAGLYVFNSTRQHVVPRVRYIAGLTVSINKHIFARLQWAHDQLYKPSEGDTGHQGDDAVIRFGFKV